MNQLIGAIVWLTTALISLPPLRFSRAVARLLARVAVWLRIDAARITRINLALCFPDLSETECAALTLSSLQHTAYLAAESGMLAHWPGERIERAIVSMEGQALLDEALDAGRGVLAFVPHFGNWEVLTYVLGRRGIVAVYDPPKIETLDAQIRSSRERFGARLVPTDRAGIRAVYDTLRDEGLVGILPDQVPERSAGVHAPFFGQPTLTMTFGHRLIQRTRPRVLLVSVRRVPAGFAVRCAEIGEGVYDEDPLVYATALNAAIETLVLTDPAQYQWEYKRFKRAPEGMPKVYPKAGRGDTD